MSELIFRSQKTIDSIENPNPDHSTSWQGWEFDLLILDLLICSIFKKDRILNPGRTPLALYGFTDYVAGKVNYFLANKHTLPFNLEDIIEMHT